MNKPPHLFTAEAQNNHKPTRIQSCQLTELLPATVPQRLRAAVTARESSSAFVGSMARWWCPCQPPRVNHRPSVSFSVESQLNSSRSPLALLWIAAQPSLTGRAKIFAQFRSGIVEETASIQVSPLNNSRVESGNSSSSPPSICSSG